MTTRLSEVSCFGECFSLQVQLQGRVRAGKRSQHLEEPLPLWGKKPSARLPAFWRYISKWRQKALFTVSPAQGWTFLSFETFVFVTGVVTTFHLLLYLDLKSSTIFTYPSSYKYWTLYLGFFAEYPLLTDHYLSMLNFLQMPNMWLWKIKQCGHSLQNPKCQCWWCTQSWVYHWRGHISNAAGTTLLKNYLIINKSRKYLGSFGKLKNSLRIFLDDTIP